MAHVWGLILVELPVGGHMLGMATTFQGDILAPERRMADERDTLARLDALSRLLDTAIGLPGTRFRIGLDSAIGVVPVRNSSVWNCATSTAS